MASPALAWTRLRSRFAAARPPLSRFEQASGILVLAGLALRLTTLQIRGYDWDGSSYLSMAVSLMRHGEFLDPGLDGAFTQHFPPLYPVVIAAFFAALGASYATTHVIVLACSAFLVAVAYFTTKDLYGRERAFAVAALVAVFPPLLPLDVNFLSESLVVAFFALTIWAILKSLDRPAFIAWAGVFASLGYLTKASMGAFVLLAGAGGLAWRFAYMRWRVLTDRHYLAAAGIVAATVLAWAARNVARHGWPNWQTQAHASESFAFMWAQPEWPVVLLQELLWSLAILAAFSALALGGIRAAAKRWREEKTSGLLMAVATPTIVAVFFVTAFHLHERLPHVVSPLNLRYLVTPIVPLLWLGFREVDLAQPERPAGKPESGTRRHRLSIALAAAGVALVALSLALDPTREVLTLGRVLLLYGGLAAGALLVALSRAFESKPATRSRAGSVTWRWVPDEGGAKRALAMLAFTAAALFVGFWWALSLVPFLVAGGLAAALRDPRARVAAAAIVLLGASSAGLVVTTPEEDIARDVNAMTPQGGVVHVTQKQEDYVWPFLREDILVARDPPRPPDLIVDHHPTQGPSPPEGYALVKTYEHGTARFPGTRVARAIEIALTGEAPPEPGFAAAYLYAPAGGR